MVVINDKENKLTFDLKLEGALLKETKAFLTLTTAEKNVQIPVKMDEQGFCSVEVKPGTLKYGTKGDMLIEVFTKDLRFVPWQSEFLIEQKSPVAFKKSEIMEQVKHQAKMQEAKKEASVEDLNKAKMVLFEKLEMQSNPNVRKQLVALEESMKQRVVDKLLSAEGGSTEAKEQIHKVIKTII